MVVSPKLRNDFLKLILYNEGYNAKGKIYPALVMVVLSKPSNETIKFIFYIEVSNV